ncbi:MAG: hypothetical protein Q9166_005013 [cf. Caloplaca sp. 2 TL-2023]
MTGLNTVNLSELNTFQQFILFLLLLLGSVITVSIAVVFVRLKAFERRFKKIVKERRKQKERGSMRRRMIFRSNTVSKKPTGLETTHGELTGRNRAAAGLGEEGSESQDLEAGGKVSPIEKERSYEAPSKREPLSINTNTKGHAAENTDNDDYIELPNGLRRKRGISFAQQPTSPTTKIAPLARILSMQGVGARHDLPNHPVRVARPENFLSPIEERPEKSKPTDWTDLIHHFSIAGIVGRNSHFSGLSIDERERLGGVEYRALEILIIVIGNESILANLSSGTRAIDGLFQAIAVRSGGFYVVTILNLRIGLLILYVIMMYISVYPVVITMRNSNVYEERSLGIYDEPVPESSSDSSDATLTKQQSSTGKKEALISGIKRRMTVAAGSPNSKPAASETRGYFVRQQLRGQLAHDLWWVVLAILFIAITETSSFERDPVTYAAFNIIFEVVSAYGTVGLSIGLPTAAYSFSGDWHVLSKLILCAVMLRGRHRGLPVAIDRAVLLPGEHLTAAEEEDGLIRMERSRTIGSGLEKVGTQGSKGRGFDV